MVKILFLILAIIFFILGVIGLIFPIIPQVPFFVLFIMFLCAASKRFKKKVISTTLYQKYLKEHIDANEKLRKFMEK